MNTWDAWTWTYSPTSLHDPGFSGNNDSWVCIRRRVPCCGYLLLYEPCVARLPRIPEACRLQDTCSQARPHCLGYMPRRTTRKRDDDRMRDERTEEHNTSSDGTSSNNDEELTLPGGNVPKPPSSSSSFQKATLHLLQCALKQ